MLYAFIVDVNGYIVNSTLISDIKNKNDYEIITPVPNNLFKPRWNGNEWIEGESDEESLLREEERIANSLIPSQFELTDAELEIKILTILMEMEMF